MDILVLLCSAPTAHLLKHPFLVSSVKLTKIPLCLSTKNGSNVTKQEASFDDMSVWSNEDAIANILSCGLLSYYGRVFGESKFCVSMFYYSENSEWMEFC